ncbi:VanZ family protein [Microbacterium sp. NPDC089695]|uniref:VanZ family protein n=1 Tax=Microbacterium sp. NPDC089695 TaxID=3364198 RepID=UPI0038194998
MSRLLPAPRRLTRGIAAGLAVPFLAGLALLTLTPTRVEERMPDLLDLVLSTAHRIGWDWLDFTRLEILANVLVFVPVGIFAFVLMPRRVWLLSVVLGPAVSLGIEIAQRLALPHRAATVSDVIANSSGAVIGVVLAIACTLLFAPRRPAARTLETP